MLPIYRLLPLLALLMSGVVATQALDVLGCADEDAAQHERAHTSDAGALDADCLCHLAYVGDAAPPRVPETLPGWEVPAPRPDVAVQSRARRRVERPPIG